MEVRAWNHRTREAEAEDQELKASLAHRAKNLYQKGKNVKSQKYMF